MTCADALYFVPCVPSLPGDDLPPTSNFLRIFFTRKNKIVPSAFAAMCVGEQNSRADAAGFHPGGSQPPTAEQRAECGDGGKGRKRSGTGGGDSPTGSTY